MNVEKIKKPIDIMIATITVVVMIALVICVVWQVFSRYVLNDPSTVTGELARFLMIWVGLLGAAYTVGLQRHLAIDLLAEMLKGRAKVALNLIINLLITAFAALVIVKGGIDLVDKVLASGQLSPELRIPMGYVYIVIPVSGVVMMFYSALFCVDLAIGLFTGRTAAQSRMPSTADTAPIPHTLPSNAAPHACAPHTRTSSEEHV
ncbi:TRAP transporter small permease [Phytohalomonas tamaricis]|uniref:TRAP transporter small permease n=1 Tax=Phytohalomonas tamaricis TaxID=2081032 RepID=UPI000D0ADEF5|nr:TRAP transporter small permease [Phytohalomonas tamaricis]